MTGTGQVPSSASSSTIRSAASASLCGGRKPSSALAITTQATSSDAAACAINVFRSASRLCASQSPRPSPNVISRVRSAASVALYSVLAASACTGASAAASGARRRARCGLSSPNASGAAWLRSTAMRRASALTFAAGTMRQRRPKACARYAPPPASSSSAARPKRSRRNAASLALGNHAASVSAKRSRASSASTRKSQVAASSRPAPSASPGTAATVGIGSCASAA